MIQQSDRVEPDPQAAFSIALIQNRGFTKCSIFPVPQHSSFPSTDYISLINKPASEVQGFKLNYYNQSADCLSFTHYHKVSITDFDFTFLDFPFQQIQLIADFFSFFLQGKKRKRNLIWRTQPLLCTLQCTHGLLLAILPHTFTSQTN